MHIVQTRPDLTGRWQQDVIFHVQNPGGIVGPFDECADPGKVVDVIAQHGAVHGAAHKGRPLANDPKRLGQVAFIDPLGQRVL